MEASLPPGRLQGSEGQLREACRTLGLAPCSMFCPGGSLLLAAGDYFSGHTKTGDLNDWKWVGGVVWLLRAPRKYLLFPGLLAPQRWELGGKRNPLICSGPQGAAGMGGTSWAPKVPIQV